MFKYEIMARKVFHHDGYDDVVTMQGDVLRVNGKTIKPLQRLAVYMDYGKVQKVELIK